VGRISRRRRKLFYKGHWWSPGSTPEQLTRATTLPWNGTGLSAWSIYLITGHLILYKCSCYRMMVHDTPDSGMPPNSGASHIYGISRAAGRHYGSPTVALGLHSSKEVNCQGLSGRYILHRVGPRTKVTTPQGFDWLSKPLILVYDGPWCYPDGFIGSCG
jgi:hypothetical protein